MTAGGTAKGEPLLPPPVRAAAEEAGAGEADTGGGSEGPGEESAAGGGSDKSDDGTNDGPGVFGCRHRVRRRSDRRTARRGPGAQGG